MHSKTLFLYYDPHPFHAELARSLKADFRAAPKLQSDSEIFTGVTKLLNAVLTLPRDYDVYFCEGTYLIPTIARTLGLLKKDCKIIDILANPALYYMKVGIVRGARKRFALNLLKKVDIFVSVGGMEDKLLKEFIPNAKSIVVYPSITPSVRKEIMKDKSTPKINKHSILIVGSHSAYYKGVDLLVTAFAKIKKEYPDAELNIVGKMDDLEKFVDCNLEGINCLGYQKNIIKIMKKSSIYVHPGRGDTYPISVIEAMLSGLPVIVSEWTGNRDIIHKLNKSLVTKLDSESIAKAIDWYFMLNSKKKIALSRKSKNLSLKFQDTNTISQFPQNFQHLLL